MTTKMRTVLTAIDVANTADPRHEEGQPEALLYGQRMSSELERLYPDGSDLLSIAARGQHVERWKMPRADFPAGRSGYLDWRRAQAVHHADVVCELMGAAEYVAEDIENVGRMLRKEGIKRDKHVQMLEDVICFVFLKWYFAPFAAKHPAAKIQRIVEKTARKMSAKARARVLAEFDLPEDLSAAFRDKGAPSG